MRPEADDYFLDLASLVATRSTCFRRHVGAVAVNCRNHVLATGYNGRAAGLAHCNQHDPFDDLGFPHACAGAFAKSGENLDACEAIHAEQNMLLQCRDVWEIEVVYCTTSPCMICTKLLMNTGAKRIVFRTEYPAADKCQQLWESVKGPGTWQLRSKFY